jgi:hypothetical protein
VTSLTRWISFVLVALALGTAGEARAHGGIPGTDTGNLSFLDPDPLGISYEFTLVLGKRQKADIVHFVGAKSWNEPENPDGLKGWTHTSNWIALDLLAPASVKIVVQRQQGVVNFTGAVWPSLPEPGAAASMARSDLVPAVSLYRGWDSTTEIEDHRYNGAGNFWSTVQYVASNGNPNGKPKVILKARLPAGHYSIAIGGNPRSLGALENYPASDCDPVDIDCFRYTGVHGYRATISAR